MSSCSESVSNASIEELLQKGATEMDKRSGSSYVFDEPKTEEINYLALQNIGVFLHAFLLSIVSITGGSFSYAFFLMYLDIDGNLYNIINAIVILPLSLKVFLAAINDCIPIFGLRRKPYMIIGWIGTMLLSGGLYLAPFPKSRYVYYDMNSTVDCSDLYNQKLSSNITLRGTDEEYTTYAMVYLAAYTLICGTVAISDAAMDGLMVQYARLEKESQRGKMQTFMYASKQSGEILRTLVAAVGLNWYEYGGPWCKGISIPGMYLMTFIVSIIAIPVVIFLTKEQPVKNPPLFRNWLRKLWYCITTKAVQRVVIFTFIHSAALDFSSPADSMIMKYWAKIDNLTFNIANIVSGFLQPLGTVIFGMYLRNYDWRITVAWTQITTSMFNAVLLFVTIFNILRNQYFYASDATATAIFNAINSICTLLIAVEMAESEIEGVFYGLVTSANNLARTVGKISGNIVAIPFKVGTDKRYVQDNTSDRIVVASSEFLTLIVENVLIFIVLPFLPSGVRAARDWKMTFGISKSGGITIVVLFIFLLLFSISYSFISPYIGL